MLISDVAKTGVSDVPNCDYCGGNPAVIVMQGYGDDASGDCHWCADCSLELARKLLDDLCKLRKNK